MDYKRFNIMDNNSVFTTWGILMHLILLWGILDVNFHSPIIQGLPSVPAWKDAPAKRLVLFVADGLRFRTFIEAPPKYLNHVMKSKGTWGVSHTRMPTESRPGIIAICAGLYEDPSAIFKGWKENPVDFDSVFNQSRFTWAWGSPDIIPIFTKGAKGHIIGDSYPHEWEEFDVIQGQIWRLDSWVFDKYLNWLREEAYKVKDLDGIIFFLHLLGCDTTGHTAKPYSREYIENMNYVDRKIEEIVQMTENFFGDNSTAYIFTADHGMTDWGSHGSGSTDETETPLIAWGAGINLLHSREDVEQVDITPLISSLIGIPMPSNNEGILPWKYLNPIDHKYKSGALLNNLKQLTYQVKANRAINCKEISRCVDWREIELDKKIEELDYYLATENTSNRDNETIDALKLAKEALMYFRQYSRFNFLIYLCIMWLGWIMLLLFKIAGVNKPVKFSTLLMIDAGFGTLLIIMLIKYKVLDNNNWRVLWYALLAIISSWLAIRNTVMYSLKLIIQRSKNTSMEVIGTIFLLATMFSGLTYRSALSVGMLSTALIQKILLKSTKHLLFLTTITLSIFPLLPVVEPHPRLYIVLLSMCAMTAVVLLKVQSKYWKVIEITRLTITGLIYIGIIDGRNWISWAILVTTPLCICLYPTNTKDRMFGIMFGFFCPLVLLSASYEPLFFINLALHLFCWPQSDVFNLQHSAKKLLTTEELYKAAVFMSYTLLAFFGTGNMASISSFDPSWTRHFVTIFSPFTMFSLILVKIGIPLILIGCISHVCLSPTVFSAVLLLGDCLSLPLMYSVTPHGSWLDIGSAISRFTIAITLPCFVQLLHYISYPLMMFDLTKFHFYTTSDKKHIV